MIIVFKDGYYPGKESLTYVRFFRAGVITQCEG